MATTPRRRRAPTAADATPLTPDTAAPPAPEPALPAEPGSARAAKPRRTKAQALATAEAAAPAEAPVARRRKPAVRPTPAPAPAAAEADDLADPVPAPARPSRRRTPPAKPAPGMPLAVAATPPPVPDSAPAAPTAEGPQPAASPASASRPARPARRPRGLPTPRLDAAADADSAPADPGQTAAEPRAAAAPAALARPPTSARAAPTADEAPDPALALHEAAADADALSASAAAPGATPARASAGAPARLRHSTVRLQPGPPRQVHWDAGSDCPANLLDALAGLGAGDGVLRDADSLSIALQRAEQQGHAVVVEDAAWAHLAALGDLHRRVDHLARLYPAGPLGPAWAEAPGTAARAHLSPRPCQLEAALFAACMGACMLADEPALEPVRELALAWQLVQRHFGAPSVSVYAPLARQAEWQAALAPAADAGVGADAATVQCLAWPDATGVWPPTPAAAAEVCILDLRDGLGDGPGDGLGDVQAWPEAAWASPWLWLLAPPDALHEPGAVALAWLQRLDRLQAGVVAAWQAGRQRDALAPLLMRRRWDDVADQWPAWHERRHDCGWTDAAQAAHTAALDALRARLTRWQRSRFLSDSEQLALQRLVNTEQQAARQAAAAALPELLQQALAQGEQRLVVFSEAGAELPALAQQLQARGLPVLTWADGAESASSADPAEVPVDPAEAVLRSFLDATGPCVLLVADAPASAAQHITCHPHRPAVIHLDRPWAASAQAQRLARLRFPRGLREVPVWQVQPTGCLASRRDAWRPARADAPGAPAALPAAAHGLRRGAALADWLDELLTSLGLPAPAPLETTP